MLPSLNEEIVGNYPQVEEAKHNCNIHSEKFIENHYFEKINFNPITSNAIVKKASKVTDLISAPIVGFTKKLLISGKLKAILEQHRNEGIQFFKSGIFHKNTFIEDYWIVNVFRIDMEFLDYKSSHFVFRKRKPEGGTFLEQVDISSFDEFKKISSLKEQIKFTQFFIDKVKLSNNISEDFFVLHNVIGGVKYIVSENLRDKIVNANCTGIEFIQIENGTI